MSEQVKGYETVITKKQQGSRPIFFDQISMV